MIAKQVLNFGVNRAVLRDLLAPSVLVPPRRLPPSRAHGSPAQPRPPLTWRLLLPSWATGTKILPMNEAALCLVKSFLDSELKMEALLVLHELVRHPSCRQSHLMSSVVTPPVFKILASEDTKGLELSFKIICDLSSDADVKSYLISLGIVSKLSWFHCRISGYMKP